ncbi:hypothetical protein AMK59_2993 [Oryctes borbonicus]|uniref:RNase NYN domain-containing protein n=1 Tax=Oryctes borbonicus TaxID=1629725 RepID=A0A0T6BBA7_9SCAR|nr:hypothetical protein AMK59_2993 [Oryctes borbonicus]
MAKRAKLSPRPRANKKKSLKSPQTKKNTLNSSRKIRRPIRKRKCKRKQFRLKNIANDRKVTYVEGPEGQVNIQITSTLSSNANTNNNVDSSEKLDKNTIHSSGENTSNVEKEKTLNDMYKTIDCVGDDTNNDVILINDDDSEVVFITEYPQKKGVQAGASNDSVILIDDDSISEGMQVHAMKNNKSNCSKYQNRPVNKQPTDITIQGSGSNQTGTLPLLSSIPIRKQGTGSSKNSKNKKKKQSMPSPIPSSSNTRAQKGEASQMVTSTPIRAADSSQIMPRVILNLANLQMSLLKVPQPIPTPTTIRTGILNEQIKQIRRSTSVNAFGSNFLNAGPIRTSGLRPIFIDGSNVAMGHSNGKHFSVEGLKICIDYFKMRGHEVTAIVPMFRKKFNQSSNPKLLHQLEKEGTVVFTPSRTVNGRHIVPYDDR